jgi:hypothetical protein
MYQKKFEKYVQKKLGNTLNKKPENISNIFDYFNNNANNAKKDLSGNSFFDIGNDAIQNALKIQSEKVNKFSPSNLDLRKNPPGFSDWWEQQTSFLGNLSDEFKKEKNKREKNKPENIVDGFIDGMQKLSNTDEYDPVTNEKGEKRKIKKSNEWCTIV